MGYRIVRQEGRQTRTGKPARTGIGANAPSNLGQYIDRLKNLIPAEVTALYIAGWGVIPKGEQAGLAEQIGLAVWALFCLIGTAYYIANQSRTVEGKPDEVYPIAWPQVFISSIAFIIWVYTLGGPFVDLGIYVPWIGMLLMLGWTFLVPIFYAGALTKNAQT